jgi:hypothetical protein
VRPAPAFHSERNWHCSVQYEAPAGGRGSWNPPPPKEVCLVCSRARALHGPPELGARRRELTKFS